MGCVAGGVGAGRGILVEEVWLAAVPGVAENAVAPTASKINSEAAILAESPMAREPRARYNQNSTFFVSRHVVGARTMSRTIAPNAS